MPNFKFQPQDIAKAKRQPRRANIHGDKKSRRYKKEPGAKDGRKGPGVGSWDDPRRYNEAGTRSTRDYEPDDTARRLATHLSGIGVPQAMIAKILGIAPSTLVNHLQHELDLGAAQATAIVANKLFAQIQANNTAAIIFWMRIRAGWVEPKPVEAKAADDDFAKMSDDELRAEIESMTARRQAAASKGLGHTPSS